MSALKHTSGPWQAEGPDDFGDHNIILSGSAGEHDRRAVAAVVSNMRPDEEVLANARLIAAAPDLMDLLKRAAEADSPSDDIRTAWWDARNAAIAKAEGRS